MGFPEYRLGLLRLGGLTTMIVSVSSDRLPMGPTLTQIVKDQEGFQVSGIHPPGGSFQGSPWWGGVWVSFPLLQGLSRLRGIHSFFVPKGGIIPLYVLSPYPGTT